MKVELTEEEIAFLKECVYMAGKEGFYSIDEMKGFEKIGMSALKKLGVDEETSKDYMKGY